MRSSRVAIPFRELSAGARQQAMQCELASEQPAELACRRCRELAVITGGYVSIRNECMQQCVNMSGTTEFKASSL